VRALGPAGRSALRPRVFVKTATLEFPHGLIVERLEDFLRMRECPGHGCEPADIRDVIDRGLLLRVPGMKCTGEIGTDGARNALEVLVCDELADSVEQRGLFWRRWPPERDTPSASPIPLKSLTRG
jgi:hypothetical protein